MNLDKEFKIFQPKYFSEFQCDPSKCSESCCERWRITVDRNTYEKYTRSENEFIRTHLELGLSINENSVNDDDFGVINLNKDMVCPFLNQENLCEIFLNLGEENLSKTCKTYPRGIILLDDHIERGLEMSCSVAANLILLNEKGIEFQWINEKLNFNDFYIVSPDASDLKQIELSKKIKAKVIEILQNREMSLDERVTEVGRFLYEYRTEKKLLNLKKNESLKSKRFHHLNTILSMKFKEGDSIGFFSKEYIDCLMNVLDGFQGIKNKDLEKYYMLNYEKRLKPYLDKKDYIIENFLVNYVFIYGIEFFKPQNIWNAYLKLCVIYSLIKFNLVGLTIYHKEMNDDLVIKLIRSLSKTIIHDKAYLDSVINYLEKENLLDFDQIKMLLQN